MDEPEQADPLVEIKKFKAHLDRLAGELIATQFAIRGLLLSHHDPAAAEQAVAQKLEEFAASALASTASDAFVHGTQVARTRIFPSARNRR